MKHILMPAEATLD